MLDIFVFSISDSFDNFHRRPILTRLSERLQGARLTCFNRPKFIFHWLFKKNKQGQQVGHISVCDLYCLAPVSWCYSSKWLMFLLVALPIRFQLNLRARKMGSTNQLIWFYKPDQWLYLKSLKRPHFFTYYDNYRLDTNYPFSRQSAYESVLADCIQQSKATFICSYKLYQPFSSLRHVHHFPNAVDESFVLQTPVSTERVRKIIGFVGVINHSIDLNLIGKICSEFPECDVVMIGPIQTVAAHILEQQFANLRFVGEVSYQQLPEQIIAFDVGICPYQHTEFNRYRNPLKIYEYSSKGIATVSSECDFFGPENVVSIARDDDAFIDAIREKLTYQSEKSKMQRIEFARNNTWRVRVELLLQQLHQVMETSRKSNG